MRYLPSFLIILGLLAFSNAAPKRSKRQSSSVVDQCRLIFNLDCGGVDNAGSSTLPPLNRDVTSPETQDGECVPYYQCKLDGTPNTDGATIIDRRISPCPGALEVFCKKASIDVTAPQPTQPIGTGGTGNIGTGGTGGTGTIGTGGTGGTGTIGTGGTGGTGTIETGGTGGTGTIGTGGTGGTGTTGTGGTGIPLIPPKPGCGWRNPNGVAVRITGAEDNQAQIAEFPWMVAVSERPSVPGMKSKYVGGGSLIHPRVVLTAAHSIEKKIPASLIVRAGEWDTQIETEPFRHQDRDVEAVIMHENFNTVNLHFDFALIIVKTPFILAPNVNPICLPAETDVFDANRCVATGWGKNNFESVGKFQAVLKKVELPVVPHAPCQSALRLTRLGKNFILDRSFICAGGEPGLDTCTGDGGSPLACPLANSVDRYVQSGIVAWGIGCGADRTPGVYGNVAKARRWIDGKLAEWNIDTSTYVASQ